MKKSLKISLGIISIALVGASIGVSIGLILRNNEKEDDGHYPYREMGIPKVIYFNSGTNKPNNEWDVPIKLYPYDNGKFWLNNVGFLKLRNYIKDNLYHGQEIATLKAINIGNTNLLKKNTRGVYYPHSREIFINVERWKNINSIADENKIHGIADTITHEYGHHINLSYFTKSRTPDAWQGDGKNKPVKSKEINDSLSWSKNFMEKFYRTLNYDSQKLIHPGKTTNFSPIASKLSLHDLFWIANGEVKKEIEGENWFLPSNETGLTNNKWNNPLVSKYDEKYAKYRYSMNEIVTRQLGQLMHVYNLGIPNSKFGEDLEYLGENGYKKLYNNFVNDLTTSILTEQNTINPYKFRFKGVDNHGNPTNQDGFYHDYMFGYNKNFGNKVSRAEEIYNAFITGMGYGKLVSNVQLVNNLKLNYKIRTNNDYFTLRANELIHVKQMIVSGFAPKDISGVYYGNEQNLEENKLAKFPSEKNRKMLWNFNRKDSIFSQKTDKNLSKPPEVIKNQWIPYTAKITNDYSKTNELYWWKDIDNNGHLNHGELESTQKLLTSQKGITNFQDAINKDAPLSTYRSFLLPMVKNLPRIEFNEKTKKMIITKY